MRVRVARRDDSLDRARAAEWAASLLDVCDRIEGKCLCPLGDACAMPVRSHILRFRDEFEDHVRQGGCPFGETSALSTLAPKPKVRLPLVSV